MAYTINLTNGTVFATIADGTINTSSSMTLIGKNYAGYGQFLDDNFMHLLENSSNTTAPPAPITGQLWWDTTNTLLKVYNGTTFKVISGATSSSTAPTSVVAGDLWYDSTNQLLKVYTGTTWLTVGPSSVNGTGATPASITDTLSVSHQVIELTAGNTIVAMVSNSATFTPNSPITGFATIKPGIQLSSTLSGAQFQGTSTNSLALNGLTSTSFLQADGSVTASSLTVAGPINLTAAGGIINSVGNGIGNIGNAGSYFGNVHAAVYYGNGAQLTGVTATSIGTLPNLTVSGAITVGGGLINSAGNGISNIGNASAYFNTVFAKATSAQYADVAERFAADEVYEAGTVVELGGSAEITQSMLDLSDKVFGVISTQAAYLMNAGAGNDQTHPPVAMTGRVPVRIIGQARKGDRLVSAGNGIARVAEPGEATAFNTIGRALADKTDSKLGTVEAIVTIK